MSEEMNKLKYRNPALFSIFTIIEEQGPISAKKIATQRYGTGSERFQASARIRTAKNLTRLIKRGAPIIRVRRGRVGYYEVAQ